MAEIKQSTAVTIRLGPFVDRTDGATAETGLNIPASQVKIRKGDGTTTTKHEPTALQHDSDGWYFCKLDEVDTDTLEVLEVSVDVAEALPTWRELNVVGAQYWERKYGSSGAGQYKVTIFVKDDTAQEVPIVDASVYFLTEDESLVLDEQVTDSNGRVITYLTSGTYKVRISDLSHTSFQNPYTLRVTGDTTQTYKGTRFSPGQVQSNTVRVYSWEYMADGVTPVANARIVAYPTEAGEWQASGGIGYNLVGVKKVTETDEELSLIHI